MAMTEQRKQQALLDLECLKFFLVSELKAEGIRALLNVLVLLKSTLQTYYYMFMAQVDTDIEQFLNRTVDSTLAPVIGPMKQMMNQMTGVLNQLQSFLPTSALGSCEGLNNVVGPMNKVAQLLIGSMSLASQYDNLTLIANKFKSARDSYFQDAFDYLDVFILYLQNLLGSL